MELAVAQISNEVTSNGNLIVKLQRKVDHDTEVGIVRRQQTYYLAVKAESIKVAVGDQVNVDLDAYNVIERPFIADSGEEMMLKWLSLR